MNDDPKRRAEAAAAENLAAMTEALDALRAVAFGVDSPVEPDTAIAWIRGHPER